MHYKWRRTLVKQWERIEAVEGTELPSEHSETLMESMRGVHMYFSWHCLKTVLSLGSTSWPYTHKREYAEPLEELPLHWNPIALSKTNLSSTK